MGTQILISETIGTMLLLLLGDGVVANVVLKGTKGNSSGWIVITWGWAMAVFIGAYAAVAMGSGAHLNPAVTIGLFVAGKTPAAEVPYYLVGEFVGAFLGAFLVWLHYYQHFAGTDDPGAKLAVFSTGPAIRGTAMNLISEIIGTFVLMFAILAIPTVWSLPGPFTVGLAVLVIGLALGGTTGYAINPARDLSPRIAHAILPIPGKGSSDWGYSWIPVVGPIIGAVIAALVAGVVIPA
ncbi:MAG: aquaporin family protein [Anaerolineae bacterium]|nr:aquaporin family protein [Anaerolineae bacterium]MCB9130556.1 aquaporin family protein [Anaerolineales bacterium]MCB0230573.1 aquaporin family protein [Anaerolineae bacterium]MCB0232832.1 aquaporin family protein [Anaerolineae bacterium]MCB0240712.1 aquaporin family protein [Anaerolineae bacterium]